MNIVFSFIVPLLLLLVRILHTYFHPVAIFQLISIMTLLQLSHMGFPIDVRKQIYSNVTQGGLKIPLWVVDIPSLMLPSSVMPFIWCQLLVDFVIASRGIIRNTWQLFAQLLNVLGKSQLVQLGIRTSSRFTLHNHHNHSLEDVAACQPLVRSNQASLLIDDVI